MMKHSDFQKGGVVSIWVGNFQSDADLDDYLNLERKFEDDFCFELNDADMPETCVEQQPTAIESLVDGFSWSRHYKDGVVHLAKEQGIEKATTMLVFLNFAYDPSQARPKENVPLVFLGAVPFTK
jgi:hypothetical protein